MLRSRSRALGVMVVLAGLAAGGGCTRQRTGVEQESEQCTFCHGDPNNFLDDNVLSAAPPRGLARDEVTGDLQPDRTATTNPGVGAHQVHLRAGTVTRAVLCAECHVVPSIDGHSYSDVPFHMGGTYTAPDPSPYRADLTFAGRAVLGGAPASYSYEGYSCQTYCHGTTLSGGSNSEPTWNQVGVGQAECGTCHGLPPTRAGHPQSTRCYACHPTVDEDQNISDKDRHIDGTVDVRGAGCSSCHGSAQNAAPPIDTDGRSDPALTSVGAHQAHLVGGSIADPVACAECHVVPTDLTHVDGTAQVTFGTLARARGFASPSWSGTTCAVYCHGAAPAGGTNPTPTWTGGAAEAACGTCHGLPPTGSHVAVDATSCWACHDAVINADMTWKDKSLHVNGQVEVSAGACDACHDAPPPTGSHLQHFAGTVAQAAYGDTSATAANATGATPSSIYGCGTCHPLDPTMHLNGVVDVELYNAGAPAGSLKLRNPATASYTPGGTILTDDRGLAYSLGTCADVYCHSGRTWTTPNGVPVPIASPTPGPGQFSWDGTYPIVYPAPVDSYVLTTRVYQAVTWGAASPGCGGCHGNPPRTSTAAGNAAGAGDSHSFQYESFEMLHETFDPIMGSGSVACRGCHNRTVTADPAVIADARYHVNGLHDVAFDQVNSYDVRGSSQSLVGATYDPTTRTCSVSCHVAERVDLPRWGDPYRLTAAECYRCHNGVYPN